MMGVEVVLDKAKLNHQINIDSSILARCLPAHLQHIAIECVSETRSTNTDLLNTVKHILPGQHHPILRQAARQTAGRGRLGRTWLGDANKMLTFSLAWPFTLPLKQLYGLSVVCGIALIQALTADLVLQQAQRLKLKWPNDVLLDEKKMAGVLIETANISADQSWAVIGIGINYHYDSQLEKLLDRELAGLDQLRCDLDLTTLLARCVTALAGQLKLFAAQGFQPFMSVWPHYDAYFGKQIDVYDGQTQLACGVAKGVDSRGQLLLQTERGLEAFMLGELSLRVVGV